MCHIWIMHLQLSEVLEKYFRSVLQAQHQKSARNESQDFDDKWLWSSKNKVSSLLKRSDAHFKDFWTNLMTVRVCPGNEPSFGPGSSNGFLGQNNTIGTIFFWSSAFNFFFGKFLQTLLFLRTRINTFETCKAEHLTTTVVKIKLKILSWVVLLDILQRGWDTSEIF